MLGEFTCVAEDEDLHGWEGGVDFGESPDAEASGFSGAGLGLGDEVASVEDGSDAFALDGAGSFESVVVDAAEKVGGERKFIPGADVFGGFVLSGVIRGIWRRRRRRRRRSVGGARSEGFHYVKSEREIGKKKR